MTKDEQMLNTLKSVEIYLRNQDLSEIGMQIKGKVLEAIHRSENISEALNESLSKSYTIPDDLDDILIEAERLGFVFHEGKWKQSGYRDRTTGELYKYLKNEIQN